MIEQTQSRYVRLARRGVLGVGGSEARHFLQNLVSNDVRRLDAATALYALLLTPQGKYLHDFFIVEHTDPAGATTLLLDVERERLGDLLRRLTLYKLRADVTLADLSDRYAVVAAFDTDAAARLQLPATAGSARAFAGGRAFVDPRMAELGARAIVEAQELPAALERLGFAGSDEEPYDALRVRAGVPDSSRDLAVDRSFPLEGALDALHGIDYGKGCYVGQELTARTHYRGTVRKRLLPVLIEGPTPAPGTPVLLGTKEAGEMRSAAGSVGIALLRLELVEESARAAIALTAGDATLRPALPEWLTRTLPTPDAFRKS